MYTVGSHEARIRAAAHDAGPGVVPVVCDLSALESVRAMAEAIRTEAGGVDAVIHLVGGWRGASGIEEPRAAAGMLERLERIVAARKSARPAGSYVAGLLGKGEAAVCRKIGEEATEVVTAALGGEGDRRVVEEIADLWFHTMVLLGARGIPLRDVLKELARRHAGRETSSASG